MSEKIQHVFLVGAKSLGAYGGYETFINKLTEYHQNEKSIKYHVACKANGDGSMDPYNTVGAKIISEKEFTYHGADCFRISIPEILGPAQAIYYDIVSLKECCRIIKEKEISNPIIYIMACRIGPFIKKYYKKLHKLGGKIYINPDGHEWMRAKWSVPIRRYWKFSERLMIKYCDLVICDSVNIEKYIHESYDGKGIKGSNPSTTFIAYGAETRVSKLKDDDEIFVNWLKEKGLRKNEYYLVVGRFVPENNYETMICEFMKSDTKKNFAIITNANDKFLLELESRLHFKSDPRIKFVGTVYNQELLMKIRENAYGYFHGHEVGGTNPSLLEALWSTKLNLLLDVGFNREVAGDSAVYWNKEDDDLKLLISRMDVVQNSFIEKCHTSARERISNYYSWKIISDLYKKIFTNDI